MASKRRAGYSAKKIARKVYRKAVRMPKRKLAKLYAAKCGKSRFKRLTGRKTKSGRRPRIRRSFRRSYRRFRRRRY